MWSFPYYKDSVDWDGLEKKVSFIADMRDTHQDSIYHGEGNVLIHTKMVVDELIKLEEFSLLDDEEKHILVTSAIFHDIAKPITTIEVVEDGRTRIKSPNHSKKGELIAREILYKIFHTPFEIREKIAMNIRYHGLPIWAIDKSNPQKQVVASSMSVKNSHLAMLSKADVLGRISDDKDHMLLKIEMFKELCIENNCYSNERSFSSNVSRYEYFNKKDRYIDYVAYSNHEFTVTCMCGLPGAGKDTYIANNLSLPILSLDDIRVEMKTLPTDKKGNGRVIQEGKERAKQYLRAKKSFVFNATNTTKELKGKWIKLFEDYGAKIDIVYVEKPYNVLLKQNSERDKAVPKQVIDKLIKKLEVPSKLEGHNIFYITSV